MYRLDDSVVAAVGDGVVDSSDEDVVVEIEAGLDVHQGLHGSDLGGGEGAQIQELSGH